MSSVLGVGCGERPDVARILFGTSVSPFSTFLFSFVQGPQHTGLDRYDRFFESKLFFIFFSWFMLFRVPRELAHELNRGLGVSFIVLLMIHVTIALEAFRRYGYECTSFLLLVMFLIYSGILYMIPVVASTPVGDVIPELKELPVSTRTPGLNHCRRLAVCRATPVYDNHRLQKGKYEKCMECVMSSEKSIIFRPEREGCGFKQRDIDARECYDCSEQDARTTDCSYTREDCLAVNMVLNEIDPPKTIPVHVESDNGPKLMVTREEEPKFPRPQACKESHGSLCWFAELKEPTLDERYQGWDESVVLSDINVLTAQGRGFPTKEICMEVTQGRSQTNRNKVVCKKGYCKASAAMARCACEQYRDVAQFRDPCAFLEANCDVNSVSYAEAVLKLKQADVGVDDIITIEESQRFLGKLDDVARQIP